MEERREQERGECAEIKDRKTRFNISLFIYSFATYANHPFPRLPEQVCVARRGQRQLRFTSQLTRFLVREPDHLPQIRRLGTLTPQSGLQVLFSVVSLAPDRVRVPDLTQAQAVEA